MKRWQKIFATASCITVFLLESAITEVGWALSFTNEKTRIRNRARRMGRYARGLLPRLGFRVQAKGMGPLEPSLIVSNHLSFWDIVILSSMTDGTYITSIETRDTPFLGQMCKAAGCVFIERRSRAYKDKEVAAVTAHLRQGAHVVLYPEGTSGDGERVLPFRKTFFQSAVDAGVPVLPVAVIYRSVDEDARLDALQDRVFYYGNQPFVRQLWKLLSSESVEVSLEFGAPIQSSKRSRSELCQEAEDWINRAYRRPETREDESRGSCLASIPPNLASRDPGEILQSGSPVSA
jgi:1-acyl-sn-glycerol-3-phosphate acyltransferase